jgi:hypothetical protein
MEPGETQRNSLHRFAADLIGLDDQGEPTETLGRLFRKLRDDDFLPDPTSHEAIQTLAGRPIAQDSLLFQEASDFQKRRLLEDVERFAAEFFSIPIEARLERWKSLVEACARSPRLIERLDALKPGLTINAGLAVDASPVVNQLIDDILTLFPMKRAAKAAEARARIDRFQKNTQSTDADRSKVLKLLRKRHPGLVELSEGYLDQFTRPRGPNRLNLGRIRKPNVSPVSEDSGNIRAFVTIGVVLLAAFSRMLTAGSTNRADPHLPRFPASALPVATPTAPNLIVRDELKLKIRDELKRLDRSLNETELDRLVAGLPIEVVPNVGGNGTARLLGAWTPKIHARFVKALKDGLMKTEPDLTEEEVDELVDRCSPKSSAKPNPDRATSP